MSDNTTTTGFSHEKVETSNFLMIVLILVVIAVGGLVEIVPLYFQRSTTQPVPGLKPYEPLQLVGRDLHRVGGKYSDEWHRLHLSGPRDLVPESNMPAYPWLERRDIDPASVP